MTTTIIVIENGQLVCMTVCTLEIRQVEGDVQSGVGELGQVLLGQHFRKGLIAFASSCS